MVSITLALTMALQVPTDTAHGGGRPCQVAIDNMPRAAQIISGTDTNYFGAGGVRAHCLGTGTTLAADSFAHYGAFRRMDLVGHVAIRDTGLALDATSASYFLRDERLEAHNNVVAVNRRTGTVLRGPNLRYLRAAQGIRDTVEMYATQRPTVEYRQSNTPSDSAPQEPYIIVADRLRFKGDDRMWAGGKVTIDRSDFASRSDSMLLDQITGFGVLVGKPSVQGRGRTSTGDSSKGYTLVGTRIELTLAERDIRAVKALGGGKATGSDWTLTADTIDLHIADRLLQHTFAWGDTARPHAVSALYTIQSDSLAIDSPGEVLTESRAFGKAFATAKRDSITPANQTDWVTGDSITLRFVQDSDSVTKRPHSRLRELLARGSARALTHHQDKTDTTRLGPAINYSRGQQITLMMLRDRIDHVIVTGKADGVHLEPRPAVEADSLKRAQSDTSRRAAPAAPPAPPPRPPAAVP